MSTLGDLVPNHLRFFVAWLYEHSAHPNSDIGAAYAISSQVTYSPSPLILLGNRQPIVPALAGAGRGGGRLLGCLAMAACAASRPPAPHSCRCCLPPCLAWCLRAYLAGWAGGCMSVIFSLLLLYCAAIVAAWYGWLPGPGCNETLCATLR